LGGTGKTSLVEFIARYLKKEDHRVAILSRGYKRKVKNSKLKMQNYAAMGDEPYMLKDNLKDIPVLVDTNRIRSANLGIRDYGVDTVILDDGLQQWKIKKDLEIVVIDAGNPFGNRRLIPRGILRQPISTLNKADIFILTKTDLNADVQGIKDFLKRINPPAEIFESIHEPVGFYRIGESEKLVATDMFAGKSVAVFSGIGDPLYFENTVKKLGLQICLSFRFADHHHYSKEDLDNIIAESIQKNAAAILTTEKDAARLDTKLLCNKLPAIFVLRIELEIREDAEKFYHRLRQLYRL
jgi:tetraacyldisaccharide 4'-kinase